MMMSGSKPKLFRPAPARATISARRAAISNSRTVQCVSVGGRVRFGIRQLANAADSIRVRLGHKDDLVLLGGHEIPDHVQELPRKVLVNEEEFQAAGLARNERQVQGVDPCNWEAWPSRVQRLFSAAALAASGAGFARFTGGRARPDEGVPVLGRTEAWFWRTDFEVSTILKASSAAKLPPYTKTL
jgi:hypothetical protein